MATIRTKIAFLGDAGAGKTALVNALQDKPFDPEYHSTIGVDFATRSYPYETNTIKLQFWDTSGQERFRSICYDCAKDSAVLVYVVDTTRELSETLAQRIINDIKNVYSRQTNPNEKPAPVLLVGNKQDLATENGKDASLFMDTLVTKIQRLDPERTLNLQEVYTLSAKTALSNKKALRSNETLQSLVDDMVYFASRSKHPSPSSSPAHLEIDSGNTIQPPVVD